jgi:hypothetical protein
MSETRIRRIRITLPARLRDTAGFDARAIAEAAGRALAEGGDIRNVTLPGNGAPTGQLAVRVAQSFKGGRHGGGR